VDALEAIHTRRSIRAYQPRPVDRALLAELVADAAAAPTPTLASPRPAFVVIEGAGRIAGYGEAAKAYAAAQSPAPGWTANSAFRVFWDAPALFLICARPDDGTMDAVRAGQTLLIAVHARGLGACWVGSPLPWLSQPAVQAELSVPGGYAPVAAIVVGYAAQTPPPSERGEALVVWAE
jgi:nitroreductase